MRRVLVSAGLLVAILLIWTVLVFVWALASGLGIQHVPGEEAGAAASNGIGIAAIVWFPGAIVAVVIAALAGRRFGRHSQ